MWGEVVICMSVASACMLALADHVQRARMFEQL